MIVLSSFPSSLSFRCEFDGCFGLYLLRFGPLLFYTRLQSLKLLWLVCSMNFLLVDLNCNQVWMMVDGNLERNSLGFRINASPVDFAAFGIRNGDRKPKPENEEKSQIGRGRYLVGSLESPPNDIFRSQRSEGSFARNCAIWIVARTNAFRVATREESGTPHKMFYQKHRSERHSNQRDAHV